MDRRNDYPLPPMLHDSKGLYAAGRDGEEKVPIHLKMTLTIREAA